MLKVLFLLLSWLSMELKGASGKIMVIEGGNITVVNSTLINRGSGKEVTNFNRMALRMIYKEFDWLLIPQSNNTKMDGAMGEFWSLIADYLNMTLVANRLDLSKYPETNSYHLLRQALLKGCADMMPYVISTENHDFHYSTPFHPFTDNLYVPSKLKVNQKWLFSLVDHKIWLVIGCFLTLFSLIGWISDRWLFPKNSRSSFGEHLFNNFAVFVIQGPQSCAFNNRMKFLTIVRQALVLLFWAYFGTFLYAQLTVKINEKQFHTVQDLLEKSNITILANQVLLRSSTLAWILDDPLYRNRIKSHSKPAIAHYGLNCRAEKKQYAIYTSRFIHERASKVCPLEYDEIPISNQPLSGAIRKDFGFKRSIDLGILKVKESGMRHRIPKKWAPISFDNTPLHPEIEPLSLSHFKYVFGLWAIGLITACIIFIGEVIIYDHQEKKKKMRQLKKKKQIKPNNIQVFEFVL